MRNIIMGVSSLLLLFSSSCTNQAGTGGPSREKAVSAIEKAEKDFEKMAAEKGMAEAFSFFADSNATIKRENDSLIYGKTGIRNYYSGDFFQKASVKWTADFVDASPDGQMGYTYGKYTWQSEDSSGIPIEFKGIFHTVWKKQNDGSWKYVWD